MATVLAACTTSLVAFAERRGLRRAEILESAGLTESAFADPNGRIDAAGDLAVWRALAEGLDDEAFGLGYAAYRANDTFTGIVGLLAHSMPTVGDALGAAAGYHRLLRDGGTASFRVDGEGGTLEWSPGPTDPWMPQMEDAIFGACAILARAWTGTDVSPRFVRMMRPAPTDARRWNEVFACPLEFGAKTTAIAFRSDALTLPLARVHGEVSPYLRIAADQFIERLDASRSLRDLILRAFTETGSVDQPVIARHFGWSARTMQRRLAEAAVHYQDLVDHHRQAIARPLLEAGDLSIIQIAHRCGFADERSFRRALARWRGARTATATVSAR